MTRVLLSVLFVFLTSIHFAEAQTISTGGFSGQMILNASDLSPVPGPFPGLTNVTYKADPSTGSCVVQFAGMVCVGQLSSHGTCDFGSEDCGGPKGWYCSVYYQGTELEWGAVYGIRCTFPGDSNYSFRYTGATSPDLIGGSISVH